jgi:hypothetical protein
LISIVNGFHRITIWKNINIQNLNSLSNVTFNRGEINIDFNSRVTNLCALTTIILEIKNVMNNNFASNNGITKVKKICLTVSAPYDFYVH